MARGSKKKEEREHRFERWLLFLSERLKTSGVATRLLYEDRARGDRMVLCTTLLDNPIELQVHRQGKGGALVLLATARAQAEQLATLLATAHRSVPRRQNAKRKFVHRVHFMASHLAESFEVRSQSYPRDDLARFQAWARTAQPMTGLEATFKQRGHEQDEASGVLAWLESADTKLKRRIKRYHSRFAAVIPTASGPRAALYANGSFSLAGTPLDPNQPPLDARSQGDGGGFDFVDAADIVEFSAEAGYELGSLVSSAGDCGGVDWPDCGSCDVPDCGGCDCSA